MRERERGRVGKQQRDPLKGPFGNEEGPWDTWETRKTSEVVAKLSMPRKSSTLAVSAAPRPAPISPLSTITQGGVASAHRVLKKESPPFHTRSQRKERQKARTRRKAITTTTTTTTSWVDLGS